MCVRELIVIQKSDPHRSGYDADDDDDDYDAHRQLDYGGTAIVEVRAILEYGLKNVVDFTNIIKKKNKTYIYCQLYCQQKYICCFWMFSSSFPRP